jgi:hypothetical protein
MDSLNRSLAGLFIVSAALAGYAQSQPQWLTAARTAWNSLAEIWDLQQGEQQRKIDLDRQQDVILRRIAAKEEVIEQLVAGRIDLYTAAARFRALNDLPPQAWDNLRLAFPGETIAEQACRQVIGSVESRQRHHSPGEAEDWACRLEADLQEHLQRYGTVRLPADEAR